MSFALPAIADGTGPRAKAEIKAHATHMYRIARSCGRRPLRELCIRPSGIEVGHDSQFLECNNAGRESIAPGHTNTAHFRLFTTPHAAGVPSRQQLRDGLAPHSGILSVIC